MTMPDWNTAVGGPESSRRRSQRVILSIAVRVSGQSGPKNAPFSEDAKTLVVNVHGALVPLAAKIEKGSTVLLLNRTTQEEQQCKVVYLGPTSGGKTQVGLEFLEAAPEFWRIAFPLENSSHSAPPQRLDSQIKVKSSK